MPPTPKNFLLTKRQRLIAKLDTQLEQIVIASFSETPPGVLYHYTKWDAAEAIIRSGKFWATAHDCMKDRTELCSAGDIILEVASNLLNRVDKVSCEVLNLLREGYSTINVRSIVPTFLTCFSAARDKGSQWREYADQGCGLCLGIPTLASDPLLDDGFIRAGLRVIYTAEEVQQKVEAAFRTVCEVLDAATKSSVVVPQEMIVSGLSALHRIAAFAAICTKQKQFESEEEWRIVVTTNVEKHPPLERRRGENIIRYFDLPLRANGRQLSIHEVIIGPNQDRDDAKKVLSTLLEKFGYSLDGEGATEVRVSEVTL